VTSATISRGFLVMTSINPCGHNLLEELVMMTQEPEEELPQFIVERLRAMAEQLAVRAGERRVIVELLGRLFARRVGRWPTDAEERSIVEHTRAIGSDGAVDAMLDLEPDALVRWLAEPVSRPRTSARTKKAARSSSAKLSRRAAPKPDAKPRSLSSARRTSRKPSR
jgi:hypothetical protein